MSEQHTTVFPARTVITMNGAAPEAEAVAIRGDRIVAVGKEADLMAYPRAELDERFKESVLMPGFVEAHAHTLGGAVWKYVYCGFDSRMDPDRRVWSGCQTTAEIIERLREAASVSSGPLIAWGYDPMKVDGERLSATLLDGVSTERPVWVIHAGFHVGVVNTYVLDRTSISESDIEGVVRGEHGPTGELQEFPALSLLGPLLGPPVPPVTSEDVRDFARDAANNGVTTITDMGSDLVLSADREAVFEVVNEPDVPVRLSAFHMASSGLAPAAETAAAALAELRTQNTDKLRFGNVKFVLDGAIQGFTACLHAPGYFDSDATGIWNMDLGAFREAFIEFHRRGLMVHVHCNGDAATEVFLDALEKAQLRYPRPDHRHTVTHSQLTTPAQYRRMSTLGACASLFINHIWEWGDVHYERTLGPDRARRMDAAATALRSGITISLHSDSPVTPLNPLRTVQHAVTRRTQQGRVLGEEECISVEDALRAVTIGAAFQLHMDAEVGSIEPGKFADFVALDRDPRLVEPTEIGAIRVVSTMLGGRSYDPA